MLFHNRYSGTSWQIAAVISFTTHHQVKGFDGSISWTRVQQAVVDVHGVHRLLVALKQPVSGHLIFTMVRWCVWKIQTWRKIFKNQTHSEETDINDLTAGTSTHKGPVQIILIFLIQKTDPIMWFFTEKKSLQSIVFVYVCLLLVISAYSCMSSDNTSMNTLPIKSKLGTLESIFIWWVWYS